MVLAVRPRKGHADEQGADRDGPGGAPGEGQRRLDGRRGRLVLLVHPAARRGGHDVAQGGQAVGERFFRGVVVGFGGDFGVYVERLGV